jgi:hypothetical protein
MGKDTLSDSGARAVDAHQFTSIDPERVVAPKFFALGDQGPTSPNAVNPTVLVPVHKVVPSDLEVISLRQCGRCFARRPLVLLAPAGLDLSAYEALLPGARVLRVEAKWMSSVRAYNRLMISPIIYRSLARYTHLLVHEPDALVLRDELDFWCREEYDYIGAPWFVGYENAEPNAPFFGVGNFGFSLHRPTMMLTILRGKQRWYAGDELWRDLFRALRSREANRLIRLLRGTGRAGTLGGASAIYEYNCDIFWGQLVPRLVKDFRIAPPEVALKFSWDTFPSRCYKMCNGALPFGLHAWARYDLAFLKPLLERAGIELSV